MMSRGSIDDTAHASGETVSSAVQSEVELSAKVLGACAESHILAFEELDEAGKEERRVEY